MFMIMVQRDALFMNKENDNNQEEDARQWPKE